MLIRPFRSSQKRLELLNEHVVKPRDRERRQVGKTSVCWHY